MGATASFHNLQLSCSVVTAITVCRLAGATKGAHSSIRRPKVAAGKIMLTAAICISRGTSCLTTTRQGFLDQSFIGTGARGLFSAAGAGTACALFGALGAATSSAGRGRGRGGDGW